MKSELDYYEILGVAPSATIKEIGDAYRKLAFQYHPDRHNENEEAHKKMQELNEAYAVLSDPIKRREYDLPRRHSIRTPKFQKGSKVKITFSHPSPYRGQTGVVDKEPIKDTFRFWYMVKVESKGFTTVRRFAEEELEKPDD